MNNLAELTLAVALEDLSKSTRDLLVMVRRRNETRSRVLIASESLNRARAVLGRLLVHNSLPVMPRQDWMAGAGTHVFVHPNGQHMVTWDPKLGHALSQHYRDKGWTEYLIADESETAPMQLTRLSIGSANPPAEPERYEFTRCPACNARYVDEVAERGER